MQTDNKGSVESPPLEINNIERVTYDLVTLESGELFRRLPGGIWKEGLHLSLDDRWVWIRLSSTDSRTLALEELYQDFGAEPRYGDRE